MNSQEDLNRILPGYAPVSAHLTNRLKQFAALVQKWTPTINIVARGDVDQVWQRHILDSVQIFQCARPGDKKWLDLGSGGGFPGIVVSILAAEFMPQLQTVLVESDKRKSVFLREVARQLVLNTSVISLRVEDLPPQSAEIISARALAPLDQLCKFAAPHLAPNGICAFLKGARHQIEIDESGANWLFDLTKIESVTDTQSTLLVLKGLKHA